jgi:Dyp-type peroxidase family
LERPINVPLNEVQGIILRGYEPLESARFLLLEVRDAALARGWLGVLSGEVTSAQVRPTDEAVNIAFTWEGLQVLGLPESAGTGFSRELQEGMDTDHRQRVLGDTGRDRSPDQWQWGNRNDKRLHVLLLLYARDETRLAELSTAHVARLEAAGLGVRYRFDTIRLKGRKEHFGFRDGIAQPAIEGVNKSPPAGEPPSPNNTIRTGEMLLGYPDGYDKLPISPGVPAPDGKALLDFGANGSYLVFRQLKQDVQNFWGFVDQATRQPNQGPGEHEAARALLAAKMVGRWPGGAPLAVNPKTDDPKLQDENDFTYRAQDADGLRAPLGSHIRRSSPRDSLEPAPGAKDRLSPEESLRVTNLHRIIRRGRQYGPPVAESMEVGDILEALERTRPEEDAERGLLFLCFNANIARQFEFVQQTWVNNPKFGGLYRDSDPVMGQRQPVALNESADVFTVQAEPVRQRYTGLPEFVQVRGGGYFFMPGIEALKYLARLPARLPPLEAT